MGTLSPTRLPLTQLSRPALLYALAVLTTGTGLLSLDLPIWVSLCGAGCILWRLMIFSGYWSMPNTWTKGLLVAAVSGGLYTQFSSSLSLELYVSMLISGLALKALEVYHTRSAQLFLYIAILGLMATLLFTHGFIATLLATLQMLLIVAALVAANSDPERLAARPWAPLKTASLTLGLSAPLLIFLFIVMPRLPPLWTMPLQKQETRIGMGEDMSPGDFTQPARSSELAFRAGFTGDLPPQSALYWRGTVLDEFDGRRWKNQCDCNYRWQQTYSTDRTGTPPAYSIVLEPHGHRWIFTLDDARLADNGIISNGENLFRARQPVSERISYDVWSGGNRSPVPLTPAEWRRYTALPSEGNPRSRELAQAWRKEIGNDEAIIRAALDRYHQSFTYTLEPPLLGPDSVDAFLFDTRRGFCEHFAGSFVFLLRAAGIPARVVMGYQGGQRNLPERMISVRQYDAHAWTEIWRPESGWVRIDPTAAVAPERVEEGFARLFPESPAFSTLLGYQAPGGRSLLGLLRIKLDYMDYLVGRWLLGYDNARQQSVLQRLGLASPQGLLVAFSGGFGLMLGIFLFYLHRRERSTRREHPLTARYRQLCSHYARLGWLRQLQETPTQFARRLIAESAPASESFVQITERFEQWRYLADGVNRDQLALMRAMRRLDWRLRLLRSATGSPVTAKRA